MVLKMTFYFSTLAILLLSLGCFLSISPALGKPAEEEEEGGEEGEEDEEGEGDEDGEANEDEDDIFTMVECVCVCLTGKK